MADFTYTKQVLSGSTNGKPILVAATATLGDVVHTATSTTDELDEVWIRAYNSDSSDVELTLEFGDATSSSLIKQTIRAGGDRTIVPGVPIGGAGSLVITAFAGTTNVIRLVGFVNNAAPTETV